jgi:AAA15 family ATPase/GTPase
MSLRGTLRSIWSATARRGERLLFEDDTRRYSEADISHLFYGHGFKVGSRIEISSTFETERTHVHVEITEMKDESPELFADQTDPPGREPTGLILEWGNSNPKIRMRIPLSPRGGLISRHLRNSLMDNVDSKSVQFVSTAALTSEEVLSLFDGVVLTPEEDLLVEALRTIEPTIERIASIGSDRGKYSNNIRQGNIVIKLGNHKDRIPIGSMGDGIWRMLGIALSLVSTENGILLIDEIDTGLHYSVLSKMWKLVHTTAERLNIQVFATTHSRDCYESLATICRDNVSKGSGVTIQRVERNTRYATAFSEQEIIAAADRGIEIR